MAPGVRSIELQPASGVPQRRLKSVIDRRAGVLDGGYVPKSREGTERIGIGAAGDLEVNGGLSSDRHAARRSKRGAVIGTDGFTDLVWVQAQRQRRDLVQVKYLRQMCAFGADVGNCTNGVSGEFLLNIEMPLLDIRPVDFAGQGDDI